MENEENIAYGAEMTFKQFIALTNYLKSFDALEEVKSNRYFNNLKESKNVDLNMVRNMMKNAWNTERILRASQDFLSIKDNYFALQWSFPQAYYSAFMTTSAFMSVNGQKVNNHSGLIDKFGEFAVEDKYPKMISFYCTGSHYEPEYHNIEKFESKSTLELDPDSIQSCQTQICQFLKSTREIQLKEKRNEKEIKKLFMTGKGKQRKLKSSLSKADWRVISSKVKPTNILRLLYRKRIKSNYRDIDSFTYKDLKADYIHNSLIGIVKNLNFINECYIFKSIGDKKYLDLYENYSKGNQVPFLDKRIEVITNGI